VRLLVCLRGGRRFAGVPFIFCYRPDDGGWTILLVSGSRFLNASLGISLATGLGYPFFTGGSLQLRCCPAVPSWVGAFSRRLLRAACCLALPGVPWRTRSVLLAAGCHSTNGRAALRSYLIALCFAFASPFTELRSRAFAYRRCGSFAAWRWCVAAGAFIITMTVGTTLGVAWFLDGRRALCPASGSYAYLGRMDGRCSRHAVGFARMAPCAAPLLSAVGCVWLRFG